jgi:hypothetical protein
MANNVTFEGDTHRYPNGFNRWNRAHQGAYRKGVRAFQAGEPLAACPYDDKRKWRGTLTWSRSFIAAWCDGWRDARKYSATRYIIDLLKRIVTVSMETMKVVETLPEIGE